MRWRRTLQRLDTAAADLAFGALAGTWLWYVLRISGEFSYWSDDLRVIEQAGTWGGLLDPYNHHLSVVPLIADRFLAGAAGFRYEPFILFGALGFLTVPVAYFVTTRSRLGAPLAAVLAVLLLWPEGLVTRPASASHYLSLAGAIVCGAALNRGRRADGVLAGALLFSLCSAGGGVVVAGACGLHSLIVRAPIRRWAAIAVPTAFWLGWYLLASEPSSPSQSLSATEALLVVRDLSLAPFYLAGLGNRLVAWVLAAAFLGYGVSVLRQGLRVGANFVVWTAAMVGWALALVQSRGALADPGTFRYVYMSMGFALLALVPARAPRRQPRIGRPRAGSPTIAAVAVLLVGLAAATSARGDLQFSASRNAALGREADGTLLVLSLGPSVIPDPTPILFFGFDPPHGTARRLRSLMERYGSPFEATEASADRQLVELGIVRHRLAGRRAHPGCTPLTQPVEHPGLVPRGLGVPEPGAQPPVVEPLELWSSEAFTIEVRRYGSTWVELAEVPAGRSVVLTLPHLSTERPWEVRASGACIIPG